LVRRNFGETAVLPDRLRAILATTVLAVAALIILLVLLS
jgi:hypothetical protein